MDFKPLQHPADHRPIASTRVGVLLVNLGTPEAATPAAVKTYLREFLSDRRVVELPTILWQPILRGIILNTRPKKSAAAYAEVWTDRGSPLAFHTIEQAEKLQARMGGKVTVEYAMRYGRPSISDQLRDMKDKGCERILIAPLYPQYSGATTATVNAKAFEVATDLRWQPAVRTLPPYYDDPAHIAALKQSVETGLAALDFEPQLILASFHGMPERTLMLGDPYHCQCHKTARLLAEALGRDVPVSFQSRFGRAKWLDPATDVMLEQLAKQGVQDIALVAPGFSVDCLETLEELAMQGRDQFKAAGGRNFAYLPCLNASDIGMDMLEKLVRNELSGWI